MTRHRKKFIKLNSIYLWHRTLGLVAAIFVIILSVTGVMLNHSSSLELVDKPVASNWLLNWYGIETPDEIISYPLGENWASQWEQQVYFNATNIGNYHGRLLGSVKLENILVISVIGQLILLSDSGEVIEVLDNNSGLPAGIKKIGIDTTGQLIVQAAHGYYLADKDLVNWAHSDNSAEAWAQQTPLPTDLENTIRSQFRQHSINHERVVLDIHSGRFLGSWGVYIMDAAAIILILLSLSGSLLYVIRSYKRRQHLAAKKH